MRMAMANEDEGDMMRLQPYFGGDIHDVIRGIRFTYGSMPSAITSRRLDAAIRRRSRCWPALLLALGLPLPKQVYGHGWLHLNGELGQDANYTEESLILRYNTDLANDLGNLLSLTTQLLNKFAGGVVPVPAHSDGVLEAAVAEALAGLPPLPPHRVRKEAWLKRRAPQAESLVGDGET